jgi:hypothetical protein
MGFVLNLVSPMPVMENAGSILYRTNSQYCQTFKAMYGPGCIQIPIATPTADTATGLPDSPTLLWGTDLRLLKVILPKFEEPQSMTQGLSNTSTGKPSSLGTILRLNSPHSSHRPRLNPTLTTSA